MTDSSDTSSISFTALYTGQVWQRNGLSAPGFDSRQGRLMYHFLAPFEYIGNKLAGGNVRTFLLQRHHIIDYLLENAIKQAETHQVLEIACGLSPRGYRFHLQFPETTYLEGDLPGMASRKQGLLKKLGSLGPHHRVVDLNILTTGPDSLEAVIEREFDTSKPLTIITEGLVNYFPLSQMDTFWKRLIDSVSAFPAATYLTDNYFMLESHPLRGTMQVMRRLLGAVSRSKANFHFGNEREALDHFQGLGFNEVTVHDPRDYYLRLPIPRSRDAPLVRVIEAKVK